MSHPAALAPASYGCGGALVLLPGATLQNQRGDAVARAVLIVFAPASRLAWRFWSVQPGRAVGFEGFLHGAVAWTA
jgi:hypothetical protein